MLKIKTGKNKKIKVLFCAAEAAPLAKVGGLADVVGSLPAALKKIGVEVSVMMPAHGEISLRHLAAKRLLDFSVIVGNKKEKVAVYEAAVKGIRFYLLQNKNYFTGGVYAGGNGRKYLFYCRAALKAMELLPSHFDIVQAHDYHAAAIVSALGARPLSERPGLILTIHNLRHQGHIDFKEAEYFGFSETDFAPASLTGGQERCLNILASGILRADKVTTVSPTYAKEIMTAEYGCELEKILRSRRADVVGILNGIDIDEYDPARDEKIARVYTPATVAAGKAINKQAMRTYLGLSENEAPLLAFIARFSGQKGLDIFDGAALAALNKKYPFQLVLLGTGEEKYEKLAAAISRKIGKEAKTLVAFNETMAHNLYAAADFFLMPSLFEPCGLTQMIAMRYGTIPLVRAVGGLKDTVVEKKTGMVFKPYTAAALTACLKKALRLYYQNQNNFKIIRQNCLHRDWSWAASAPAYRRLYEQIESGRK